jgi:hypothetical protein
MENHGSKKEQKSAENHCVASVPATPSSDYSMSLKHNIEFIFDQSKKFIRPSKNVFKS